jgi:hypothetical protein
MARGEHQTTEALLDVLGDFRVALPTPSLGHGGSNPEGLLPGRRGEDRTQVCNKLLACQCAHCGEKFYLSSLPCNSSGGSPLEVPSDRRFQLLVLVGDVQLDSPKLGSWSILSTIPVRKPESSSRTTPCAISSVSLRWCSVVLSSYR